VRNHLSPELGGILADRLTTNRILEFIEKKQKEGLEDATINRFLEALRKGYHLGRDASPALVVMVPKIRMLKLDNVREGTLEPEAYRRLLGFLPFYLQMVLVIGYHYGMRRGEILKLRWDQVDWACDVIRLERKQTKGKQARVAPIYGEVRAWLERAYLERREGELTIVSYRARDHVRRPGGERRPAAGLGLRHHASGDLGGDAEDGAAHPRSQAGGRPVGRGRRGGQENLGEPAGVAGKKWRRC
jgi:integrase